MCKESQQLKDIKIFTLNKTWFLYQSHTDHGYKDKIQNILSKQYEIQWMKFDVAWFGIAATQKAVISVEVNCEKLLLKQRGVW